MSTASSSTTAKRVVLLFLHGGSYNKDCWKPIVRRLQQSPLLQRVPHEVAAFNFRFHGEKRDSSIKPRLYYRNGDKDYPRIDHPLFSWTEWAPQQLEEEIAKLREDDQKLSRRTHIVGIGHSMGATSLLKVETENPGTLDGIIAFEPVFNDGSFTEEHKETVLNMLVNVSLAREGEWDTWEDVENHLKTARSFKRWDPEALEAFIPEGIEKTEDGKRFRLVVSPAAEASIYCHNFITFREEDFARAKSKIVMEHAARTVFFREKPSRQIAEKLKGHFFVADAIPNTTHSMVVEDPASCAQHIIEGLEKFPVIQEELSAAKL